MRLIAGRTTTFVSAKQQHQPHLHQYQRWRRSNHGTSQVLVHVEFGPTVDDHMAAGGRQQRLATRVTLLW